MIDLRDRLGEDENFGALKDSIDYEKLSRKIGDEYIDSDSVSRKAAKLLYGIIKNEPFVSGNEQIGGLLFVVYLTMNQIQLSSLGETKISDRALTALVLLISESVSDEKELLLDLICKLLESA